MPQSLFLSYAAAISEGGKGSSLLSLLICSIADDIFWVVASASASSSLKQKLEEETLPILRQFE
jgi:hypothetical protein